jgi:hypothetical protein
MSSKRTLTPRCARAAQRMPATGSVFARRTSAKLKIIRNLHKPSASSSENRDGKWLPPWVVGTRGVLDATGIQEAMTFLEIPVSKRKGILRKSATASMEALLYMHRVRKSGASRGSIRLVSVGGTENEAGRHFKQRRESSECFSCHLDMDHII